MYELICGVAPSRPNLPPLTDHHEALESLDGLIQRMTKYDPSARPSTIDEVIADFAWSAPLAVSLLGSSQLGISDLKKLKRQFTAVNDAVRSEAIEAAVQNGKASLGMLHELVGHRMVEVRRSAIVAMGRIGHTSSLRFLVAALRPVRKGRRGYPVFQTAEAATAALCRYDPSTREHLLCTLDFPLRENDLELLLDGIPPAVSYEFVENARSQRRISGDTLGLALLFKIDATKATSLMLTKLEESHYSGQLLKHVLRFCDSSQSRALIQCYVRKSPAMFSHQVEDLMRVILKSQCIREVQLDLLQVVRGKAAKAVMPLERDRFLKKIDAALRDFEQ